MCDSDILVREMCEKYFWTYEVSLDHAGGHFAKKYYISHRRMQKNSILRNIIKVRNERFSHEFRKIRGIHGTEKTGDRRA